MRMTRAQLEGKAAGWLKQGISPRRLAATLALGFVIGCVPVVGIPTVACTAVALALGLNMPAIQVANYAAMPFQLALIVPFLKLGTRVLALAFRSAWMPGSLIHSPVLQFAAHAGSMAGQALLGWLLVAAPAVLFITLILTVALKRVPALRNEA